LLCHDSKFEQQTTLHHCVVQELASTARSIAAASSQHQATSLHFKRLIIIKVATQNTSTSICLIVITAADESYFGSDIVYVITTTLWDVDRNVVAKRGWH